ncbi:hypothetical protein [Paraburkholderia sp. J11-2]|uniref:hypothetical protein n=1 Tax=Paraburkholderia sp. J11-2 TaxID=2805431 RepID=UPI002AB6897A|nr:hypothetical protein [Paraburkholderia sp. J11-2]
MQINEQRALVLPIVTETVTKSVTKKVDGKDVTETATEDVVKVWAYHTPISKEVFDSHFRVLASTKSALSSKGAHYLRATAPRVAYLTLKDEGKKDALSRGSIDAQGNVRDDDTPALLAEMKRLTMILAPGANGWDLLPVDMAISTGKMDAEDWEEVASSITFFSCHYVMARKADREVTAQAYAFLLDASISSLSATEFAASLPSSTPAQPTPNPRSLIPS